MRPFIAAQADRACGRSSTVPSAPLLKKPHRGYKCRLVKMPVKHSTPPHQPRKSRIARRYRPAPARSPIALSDRTAERPPHPGGFRSEISRWCTSPSIITQVKLPIRAIQQPQRSSAFSTLSPESASPHPQSRPAPRAVFACLLPVALARRQLIRPRRLPQVCRQLRDHTPRIRPQVENMFRRNLHQCSAHKRLLFADDPLSLIVVGALWILAPPRLAPFAL